MAHQSTQSIVVDAPAADVMAVIADFPPYPQWGAAAKKVEGLEDGPGGGAPPGGAAFPAYPRWVAAAKKVEVLEGGPGGRAQRVHFVLDAGAVKDDYVLDYPWDGDRQVSWTLVKGQMQKRQDGSYTLVEKDGSTEVTYSITIDLSIPMLGMIKRKAEKVILDTALKELKKRVES